MTTSERINVLCHLGQKMIDFNDPKVEMAILKAHHENQWFVPENTKKALFEISKKFLQKEKLQKWIESYSPSTIKPKNIGLVLAGNIPLVGFHDLLCVFVSGHRAIVKTSSKDDALVQLIISILTDINSDTSEQITTTDRLNNFDAVIATGSNNTAQHFEYYFKEYPKIIRKNRVSIGILDGTESENDLQNLGDDVFEYFGLGCRNISKIFIPREFKIDQIFEAFYKYKDIIHHNKYNNNYAYNEAIWLMGQDNFLTNGFIILKEEENLHSRIASLYYERYDDIKEVTNTIKTQEENIQCISTNASIPELSTIPLGKCQSPTLSDYADNVDTMDFLLNL